MADASMYSGNDPRLGQLLEGIVRLAAGDLTTRIEISEARDEIDAVIMGTNLLAEDLQIVYEELEQRVQARTQQLNEAHQAMRRMAMTDPLTGLSNRSAFAAALSEAQNQEVEGKKRAAILLLDMDGFKAINDSLGHTIGDKVLETVAHRISGAVRDQDMVARMGGDEFAVLIPGVTPAEAAVIGNRILADVVEPMEIEGQHLRCGVSMGLRMADPGQSAEELMMEADIAMYESKADGRGKLKLFAPEMLLARQMRNQLVGELKEAIAGSQLVLYYQPIIRLDTREIEGVEALVRWNHPTRGLIMPDEFIPIAEETGMISDLGGWVLRTAVEQLKQWRSDPLTASHNFSMRINVSAADLQRLEFVEDVREALSAAGLDPSLLVLELTESAVIQGNDLDRYTLNSLRRLGVGLEIDDFGTGYSSISYLRQLPVDTVKVDRTLLSALGSDPSQPALLAAVLQLIKACGLNAVWEGIETAEQAEYLLGIGCTSGQGYYFSRPLAAAQLTEQLKHHKAWPVS
ncbi:MULTISPECIES: putative bifunctional diguanylate cyclase/phosphodiesterase [Paenarthrobacter]|uniref:putative bifunctional diguanylate cyclase/phosphodiesterase n=1 Tax=Paenarthrobacter TaxID=1742992 RepID=UPI0023662D89|nr:MULTISPECIES: EAL domain-containing protein [Paenarthrobacter]MDD7835583.1 EAL domain-containing protein [Paenarthrobacter sp. AB444]MDP9936247.1 diguanylate cyclase (GGDEF)-like protein [Paenarthrobacter nicotinovorans]